MIADRMKENTAENLPAPSPGNHDVKPEEAGEDSGWEFSAVKSEPEPARLVAGEDGPEFVPLPEVEYVYVPLGDDGEAPCFVDRVEMVEEVVEEPKRRRITNPLGVTPLRQKSVDLSDYAFVDEVDPPPRRRPPPKLPKKPEPKSFGYPLLDDIFQGCPPDLLAKFEAFEAEQATEDRNYRFRAIEPKRADTILSEIGTLGYASDHPETLVPEFDEKSCRDYVDKAGSLGLDEDEAAADLAARFLRELHDGLAGDIRRTRPSKGEGDEPLLCSHCSLPFLTRPALIRHLQCVHEDESLKLFTCRRCSLSYSSRSWLIRHFVWSRFGKSVQCRIFHCYQYFATRAERNEHLEKDHGGFTCDECGDRFLRYENWGVHVDSKHDETRVEMTCRICAETLFESKTEFHKHEQECRMKANELVRFVRDDSAPPPPVPTDPKPKAKRKRSKNLPKPLVRLTGREYTRNYFRRKEESYHRCSICRCKCYTEEKRVQHEKKNHVTNKKGEVTHICIYCPHKCSKLPEYKRHLKTHPGHGEFPCQYCPKVYMTYGSRQLHIEKDHLQKRYTCKDCGAAFKRLHIYRDHMSTHGGQPGYACPDCGKTFYHGPTYYDHKRFRCPLLQQPKYPASKGSAGKGSLRGAKTQK